MKLTLALEKIKKRLAKRPEVLAVYLFGSIAKGYSRPKSDLDLAILTMPGFKPRDYSYQIKIEEELNSSLPGFKIDVVHINDVGLPLQFSAVVKGKLIYSKDDLQRAVEEIKISNRYEDLEDFYQLRLQSNLERAKKDLHRKKIYAR